MNSLKSSLLVLGLFLVGCQANLDPCFYLNAGTNCTVPADQNRSLTGTTASGQLALSWTDPTSSAGFIVVRRTGSAVTFTPSMGQTYNVGAIDSNHTVIFVGTGGAVTDNGLDNGTYYYYSLFAFDATHHYSKPLAANFMVGCDDLGSGVVFAGSGTSGDPYVVCTADQLNQIGTTSALLSANFKLVADVDLVTYDLSSPSKIFSLIGSYGSGTAAPYTGTFDGNHHSIMNLKVDQSSTTLASGFFSNLTGATVKNLSITGASITGTDYVGVLTGYAHNSQITNVHVTGAVTGIAGHGSRVAGLIGHAEAVSGTMSVTNSISDASVTAVDTIGGFIGFIEANTAATVIVSGSQSTGNVVSTPGTTGNSFGGFFGYVDVGAGGNVSISNNSASGNVSATGSWNGGFASTLSTTAADSVITATGNTSSGSITTDGTAGAGFFLFGGYSVGGHIGTVTAYNGSITITHSTSSGAVFHNSTFGVGGVGGFFGSFTANAPGTATARYNVSTGAVHIANASVSTIGGFLGNSGGAATLSDSYCTGAVNAPASDNVGGFAGDNGGALISNSYQSGTVTGATHVGGFVGNNQNTITNSYWNVTNTASGYGQGTMAGASGLTNAQMPVQASYLGFDFTTVWNAPTAGHPPTLR